MSVTIKGMEMPKNCYDCPMSAFRCESFVRNEKLFAEDYVCVLTGKQATSTKRNRFCPLVEEESE